jgi:transposase
VLNPKLACGRCDKIVQAEAESRPIARGLSGPGLLSATADDHLAGDEN